MKRFFCLRFDVDTHVCVRAGMPRLLELAGSLGTSFTFFVNMGRAVSRRAYLRKVLSGETKGSTRVAAKLPAGRKLGPKGSLTAMLANPLVGAASPEVLRRAVEEGHEVGLHGGRNHAVWQRSAQTWTLSRLGDEISFGHHRLIAAAGMSPAGFTSPGWNSPAQIGLPLAEMGYEYLADLHGPMEGILPPDPTCPLPNVRTNFTGEPGGVAYLEHLRARGLGEEAILDDFRRRLDAVETLAVAYDHPYFAGVTEISLVAGLLEEALRQGLEVTTLAEAVKALR